MKRKSNPIKSAKVKVARGASPEEIASEGELIGSRVSTTHEGQFIEVYDYDGYVWAVVIGDEPLRYITAYKSRKLKKEYNR